MQRAFVPTIRVMTCVAVLGLAASTWAQPVAPVRFAKLFSTLDGYWQAIELDIDTASGAPLQLGGRQLTFLDRSGKTRSQTLPATWDGPVKRGKLLLANVVHDGWNGVEYGLADLALDRHVLPIDGGTITLEGQDSWSYGALPLDGRHALARDGTRPPAILGRYFEAWKGWIAESWDLPWAYAREYRHAALDRYLLTAHMTEIDLLDRGAIAGWAPTGRSIRVFARPQFDDDPAASRTACRFLATHDDGPSHFVSIDARECALLASSTLGTFETPAAFHGTAPDPVTGACPDKFMYDHLYHDPLTGRTSVGRSGSFAPMLAVYRLWNGKGSHRLIDDPGVRNAMIAAGWMPEGYGPDGVMFCTY